MKEKILTASILAVFMLVAISFASAVSTNTTNAENKESPLWAIRARQAIKDKVIDIIKIVKTKYVGERAFYIPFQSLIIKNIFHLYTTGGEPECSTQDVLCTSDMRCTSYCK